MVVIEVTTRDSPSVSSAESFVKGPEGSGAPTSYRAQAVSMAHEGVPADVRQFLDRCIDSLEQLEVLLLIRRSSGSAMTAVTVARELGSTLDSVKGRLRSLAVMGLADEAEGSYRYRSDPTHDAVVELVAQAYRERRVSMITYIVNSPSKTLRAFSDAFRLRDPRSP